MRTLNEKNITISQFCIKPEKLADILKKIDEGKISNTAAKMIFNEMLNFSDKSADEIIAEKNLSQVTDEKEIDRIVDEVIKEEHDAVESYRSGKTKAIAHLVGIAMKKSKGKANPVIVNKLLENKLK